MENSINENFRHLIDPFWFEGGDIACLLLHGYTGSPSEMKPLGEFLSKNGIAASGPLLPGHGTSVQDLDTCDWMDWHNFVEAEWKRLKRDYKKVFVIGLSMGGALALHLSAHNNVDGVVTLASGVKLADWRLPMMPVVRHFIKKVKKTRNSYARGPDRIRFAYEYNPMKATRQIVIFYRHLSETLSDVTAPLLIIHSKDDIILRFENTEILTSNVGSSIKKVVALENAKHIITLSDEQDTIHNEVLDFVNSHFPENRI